MNGMSANDLMPAGKEKTQPAPFSKLAYKGKKSGKKPMPENKETPAYEAREHSAPFLRKAASMAGAKGC